MRLQVQSGHEALTHSYDILSKLCVLHRKHKFEQKGCYICGNCTLYRVRQVNFLFWIWNAIWKRKLSCRTLYKIFFPNDDFISNTTLLILWCKKYIIFIVFICVKLDLHDLLKYSQHHKETPWSESASELYRPSDCRWSAKWLPTFCG
jgi:hypothetical protein